MFVLQFNSLAKRQVYLSKNKERLDENVWFISYSIHFPWPASNEPVIFFIFNSTVFQKQVIIHWRLLQFRAEKQSLQSQV